MISGLGKSLKRFVTSGNDDSNNFDDLLAGLNDDNKKLENSPRKNDSLASNSISSHSTKKQEAPTIKDQPTIKQFGKKESGSKIGSESKPKQETTEEGAGKSAKPATFGGLGTQSLTKQSFSGSDREVWKRLVDLEAIYETEKQIHEHQISQQKKNICMMQEELRSKLFEADKAREGNFIFTKDFSI